MRLCKSWRLIVLMSGFLAGCAKPEEAKIEAIGGGNQTLLPFRMQSLSGVRDGDLLKARLVFDGGPSPLVMSLIFRIGAPTRLELGNYRWERTSELLEGKVRALSVTFLGGQGDRPSLGGVFELLSPEGVTLYKVTLPTRIVSRKAAPETATPH